MLNPRTDIYTLGKDGAGFTLAALKKPIRIALANIMPSEEKVSMLTTWPGLTTATGGAAPQVNANRRDRPRLRGLVIEAALVEIEAVARLRS